MDTVWRIEVCGVRGSAPAAHRDFLEYGGNTSCILAECGQEAVILDGGSGLLGLGHRLLETGKRRVHLLLTHLHLDHVCGLFGFPLFYDSRAEVHVYGRTVEGKSFEESLKALLGSPYWPVGLLPGEAFFLAGEKQGQVRGCTLPGNHPGGSLLYRLEALGKSVVYGLDCEMNGEMQRDLVNFSRGADLLIWDANFTKADLESHPGWGHSSWEQGICLGREGPAALQGKEW